MSSRTTRIAVLMPVYNAGETLIRTLESLDRQHEDFDFLIVDDGSQPPLALDAGLFRHPLTLLRLPNNQGIDHALNEGLRRAMADGYDFVARQDDGDLELGERLSLQKAFLDQHPDAAVVGVWIRFVDPQGKTLFVYRPPTQPRGILRRMRYSSAIISPGSMIRVSALKEAGVYSSDYPVAEDYELYFRLCQRFPCYNIGQVLVMKEENPEGLSAGKRKKSLISRVRVQLKYFSLSSIHSYMGLMQSILLLVVPYGLLIAIKRKRKKVG